MTMLEIDKPTMMQIRDLHAPKIHGPARPVGIWAQLGLAGFQSQIFRPSPPWPVRDESPARPGPFRP